jgi:hypothetical protein
MYSIKIFGSLSLITIFPMILLYGAYQLDDTADQLYKHYTNMYSVHKIVLSGGTEEQMQQMRDEGSALIDHIDDFRTRSTVMIFLALLSLICGITCLIGTVRSDRIKYKV